MAECLGMGFIGKLGVIGVVGGGDRSVIGAGG